MISSLLASFACGKTPIIMASNNIFFLNVKPIYLKMKVREINLLLGTMKQRKMGLLNRIMLGGNCAASKLYKQLNTYQNSQSLIV